MNADPFHAGEREAQRLAGTRLSGAAIRNFMPDQHRAFFAMLPFLPIATLDGAGWPVATILTGSPGFVASPDPQTLRIGARPDPDDPIAPHLVAGAPVQGRRTALAPASLSRMAPARRAASALGFPELCTHHGEYRNVDGKPGERRMMTRTQKTRSYSHGVFCSVLRAAATASLATGAAALPQSLRI